MEKILITGAAGQLGSELTQALVDIYGGEAIIATDVIDHTDKFDYCHFQTLDVMDREGIKKLIKRENIQQVYHLAAILSALGEKKFFLVWEINMSSLLHLL